MQYLCLYNHYLPTSLTSTATILGSLQQERFSYLLYEQKNFVKFWNDLDISIRETKPKHKFIKKFKKLVFESYQ